MAQSGAIAKMVKMLNPTWPKIGTDGKNAEADKCDKMQKSVKMVKWQAKPACARR